jgi:hypothetical protein
MVESMTFAAQKKGGGAHCLGGDIYVSCNSAGSVKESLSIRFSEDTLDRLRWRIGDRVILHVDKEGDLASWTITRSTDDDDNSLKISGRGQDQGTGTVRRRVSHAEADFVFGEHRTGYQCRLLRGDSRQAIFNKVTDADDD